VFMNRCLYLGLSRSGCPGAATASFRRLNLPVAGDHIDVEGTACNPATYLPHGSRFLYAVPCLDRQGHAPLATMTLLFPHHRGRWRTPLRAPLPHALFLEPPSAHSTDAAMPGSAVNLLVYSTKCPTAVCGRRLPRAWQPEWTVDGY